MSLTAAEVAEIMRLVEQSTFDELTLEMDGVKLSLRRGAAVQMNGSAGAPVVSQTPEVAKSQTETKSAPPAARASATPTDANSHDVRSPLLGTFYRSPKPGAPPFIEVGAKVEDNTVIAIIEVMKLMNTVRAGKTGTVTAIFINDGELVEFDQPLIRIDTTG